MLISMLLLLSVLLVSICFCYCGFIMVIAGAFCRLLVLNNEIIVIASITIARMN